MTSTAHLLVRPGTLRVALATSTVLLLASACTGSSDAIGSAAAVAPTSTPSPPSSTSPVATPPTIDGVDVIVTDDVATLLAVVADDDLVRVEVDWGDGQVDTTADAPAVRLEHRYRERGSYVVSIVATDAAGEQSVASATATVDLTEETTPESTAPPTTAPPTTTPTPTTTPAPAPGPAPTPTTTTPPTTTPPTTTLPPAPDPIEVDLMAQTSYQGSGSAPDGAGGSGTARQLTSHEFGIRSDAHHGYNGRGTAQASLEATIDARPFLDTLPETVVGFEVAIDWSATASGTLKHPWDRTASILVTSSLARYGVDGQYVDGDTDELIDRFQDGDDDRPVSSPDFDGGGTFTATLSSDTPIVEFRLAASCTSTSGPMAFALLNEGYCDYLDQGSIELTGLRATLTPIIADATGR